MYKKLKITASATIVALGFMFIASTLAVTIAFKQGIYTKWTNDWLLVQKMRNLHGQHIAEVIVKIKNNKDKLEFENKNDNLTDDWAKIMSYEDSSGIFIKTIVVDANSFFNLNNLLVVSANNTRTTDHSSLLSSEYIFRRLLQLLMLENPDDFLVSINKIIRDIKNRQQLNNRQALPMVSITELNNLPSMSPKILEIIEPYVIAIPLSFGSEQHITIEKINPNTALPKVLAAALDMSMDEVNSIISARPFVNMQAFNQKLSSINNKSAALTGIDKYFSVSSKYFIVKSELTANNLLLNLYTWLYKDKEDNIKVLWTNRGTF